MKKTIIVLISFLIAAPAIFAQTTKAGRTAPKRTVEYYTCSMHTDVVRYKPGKCPKCGMALRLSLKEQMKMDTKKDYTCSAHPDVVTHDPGQCPKCGKKLNLSSKEQMKAEIVKVYTCPMHPDVALDKEGKCPKCGGNLVEKKQ